MEDTDFDLTTAYSKLKQKYELPNFNELSENFDIEKTIDKESIFLIREIRRTINEKLSAYTHLFETLLNPTATPMFMFSILRGIDEDNKKKIKEVYKKLSKLQIKAIKLDTIYSEQAEVEFIKNSFNEWQDLKKTIYEIIEKFDKDIEEDNSSKERGYFG
ncbi:hypothetical protein KAJ38_01535 [Candidatus Pacearchaeota archaeon]|nr:hypothetical protein [Candidatus Pacearchaeota archaeon]